MSYHRQLHITQSKAAKSCVSAKKANIDEQATRRPNQKCRVSQGRDKGNQQSTSYIDKEYVLTLPWLKPRGFFLQPARLPRFRLTGDAVAANCPEAFRTATSVLVSECPSVPFSSEEQFFSSASCRMLRAAF